MPNTAKQPARVLTVVSGLTQILAIFFNQLLQQVTMTPPHPDFSPTGIEDEGDGGDRGVEEEDGEKTSPTSRPSLPSPPLICRLVRNSGPAPNPDAL
ncbi:MAG: hypothetical protein ICV55_06345 [Coleofasciculus sp. C3-bin4]|nr:hypothetical protein [Coleofasciculus sp. C3-bin4]